MHVIKQAASYQAPSRVAEAIGAAIKQVLLAGRIHYVVAIRAVIKQILQLLLLILFVAAVIAVMTA